MNWNANAPRKLRLKDLAAAHVEAVPPIAVVTVDLAVVRPAAVVAVVVVDRD